MNYELMLYVLLTTAKIEGVLMMLPALVSFIYKEYSIGVKVLILSLVLIVVGTMSTIKKPKRYDLFFKEGLLIVGMVWVIFSILGALPFIITGSIPNYVDAFFETVSGFTTTGATNLIDVEALPKGITFWRSFTHWIGGMGVLVFVMAIVPLAGSRSMNIMKAEVPGPSVDKLVPKTKQTAKILYLIYIVLTIIQVILLCLGGMPFFDSILHSFSTAGTGGFSNRAQSIGYYNSAYIETVITVFMILFGINFNLFYLFILKKFSSIFKSEELRVYLLIILFATVAISINTLDMYGSFMKAFRYSSFQVASIITTTGFMTTDFNLWPNFSKSILFVIMFIGSCAGSTGGGLKVSRVVIALKYISCEIKTILHPKVITYVKVDGKIVEETVTRSVAAYLLTYMTVIVFSYILISLNEFDFETNLTAIVTCINNVGPGFGNVVGPTESFHIFSDFSKIILSFDMLLGRLEVFPIILLLNPKMYKRRF